MIKLDKVSKIYYNNGIIGTGFSKVSLELKTGEYVVVVGESGSGKSTLLNVISGLDSYEEGEMYINGEETSHFSESDFEDYRRKYVANIFQAFNLINSYTVKQNVELVLLINGYDKKSTKSRVNDILKKVKLWDLRNKKVSKLSGGQKQRVAIARALAKETPIIVADEPTGNLDQKSAKQIFELLHEISKDKLVLVVTHNFEQVEKYATRVIRMHDGKVVEDKKIKETKEINVSEAIYNKMRLSSKWLLAFRNAFNVIPKFLIILFVFFIVSMGLLSEYAGYKNSEYDTFSSMIMDGIFKEKDPRRIIINKQDKSILSNVDREKITSLEHVNRYDDKDFINDSFSSLCVKGDDFEFSPCIGGYAENINDFKLEINKGRYPKNDKEVIFVANKESYDLGYSMSDWFNKDLYVSDTFNDELESGELFKIVGIAYDDRNEFELGTFYGSDLFYNTFSSSMISYKYTYSLNINEDNELDEETFTFLTSSKVPKGEIYYNESYDSFCKNFNCHNKNVTMKSKSIYSEKSINLKMSKSYNESNKKKIFGKKREITNEFVINREDLKELIDNDIYQASIYLDNVDYVDDVMNALKDMGYNAYAIKNTAISLSEMKKIYEFFNHVLIVIVIFILFFVSYFIIYMCLKSRVTYFAVVRMLGGNIKMNKNLVSKELFIDASLSYVLVIGLMILTKLELIKHIKTIDLAISYLKGYHFIIIYIILIIMSQLISRKYSKKIFKDTMISTYNMEV